MENQHSACVPMTKYLWQRSICDHPFPAQAPIVSLFGQCFVWMIIFYGFYHCQLFFQSRQREARQPELLNDHPSRSDAESKDIEKLCLVTQTPSSNGYDITSTSGAA